MTDTRRHFEKNVPPHMKLLLWAVPDFASGCWNHGGTFDVYGYGQIDDKRGNRQAKAHRVIYEHMVGPIPDGLVIDHLCRNRACLNPNHMEPVTVGENVRRKPVMEECKRGHRDFWKIQKGGHRKCMECQRVTALERYAKNRERLNADR